jgi:hypothetical protein
MPAAIAGEQIRHSRSISAHRKVEAERTTLTLSLSYRFELAPDISSRDESSQRHRISKSIPCAVPYNTHWLHAALVVQDTIMPRPDQQFLRRALYINVNSGHE